MKIAVIGTGTAGILSIAFVLAYAPEPVEVYSIHNPKKPILGIGESTSTCLLYTSPSPRDKTVSRMPSSA